MQGGLRVTWLTAAHQVKGIHHARHSTVVLVPRVGVEPTLSGF